MTDNTYKQINDTLRQATDRVEVDPMFTARWSPRAMSGEAVSEENIRQLIEAARWAPSCFNA